MKVISIAMNEEYEKKLQVIINYCTTDWKKGTISDAIKLSIHNEWINIQKQYYEEGNEQWCDQEWLKNYKKYN